MDDVKARDLASDLEGNEVAGWQISRFLGAGKSAIVLEGHQSEKKAAIKVFDPELVKRFGQKSQLERIDREKALVGKVHENLVQIYDGGLCPDTGYLYVAMEFIDAPNLESVIKIVPRERIQAIITQIASAAEFLEATGLAHRDIKPSNIVVDEKFERAILLDLGILRPIGDSDLTNSENAEFIGTLRYASPEFLTGQTEDTVEGWRSVTFYQLGAVLHDLVMRSPIFVDAHPYANLVSAVLHEVATVEAADVDPELQLLAKNCLTKNPNLRLELLDWNDFHPKPIGIPSRLDRREEIRRKLAIDISANNVPDEHQMKQLCDQALADLQAGIDAAIRYEFAGDQLTPPIIISHTKLDSTNLKTSLTFGEAPSKKFTEEVVVSVATSLVDAGSKTIKIHATLDSPSNDLLDGEVIYEGVFDRDVFKSHMADFTLRAISVALDYFETTNVSDND